MPDILLFAAIALALAAALLWRRRATASARAEAAPAAAVMPAPESLRQTAQGFVVGRADRHQTHAWLGIPFAQPPVGPLRWKAPRPPQAWDGVREALAFGRPALQLGGVTLELPPALWGQPAGSEDCLTLNVFAPQLTPEQSRNAALPVMFWIHGGANTAGTAATYTTLRNLAGQDQVIVVSANYRLGILGWFSLEELARDADNPADRSGNFGTLDLIAALQWVRQHIAAFGGDPDNVTVFGESAGGLNAYTLLASPLAKGLFHRAILQSPLAVSYSPAQARNYADDTQPGHTLSSRELLCLWLQRDGRAADRDAAKALIAGMQPADIAAYVRGLSDAALLAPITPGTLSFYDAPCVIQDGHVLPAMPLAEVFADRARYHAVAGHHRHQPRRIQAVHVQQSRLCAHAVRRHPADARPRPLPAPRRLHVRPMAGRRRAGAGQRDGGVGPPRRLGLPLRLGRAARRAVHRATRAAGRRARAGCGLCVPRP